MKKKKKLETENENFKLYLDISTHYLQNLIMKQNYKINKNRAKKQKFYILKRD